MEEEFSVPLKKEDLLKHLENLNREFIDREGIMVLLYNKGIPQMLITSLSQFSEKSQENLIFEDAINFYRIINKDLGGNVNHTNLKKWRKNSSLTFFGVSQYAFLEYYLKNVD